MTHTIEHTSHELPEKRAWFVMHKIVISWEHKHIFGARLYAKSNMQIGGNHN